MFAALTGWPPLSRTWSDGEPTRSEKYMMPRSTPATAAAALPDVPIVGIGGVQRGWDALELLAAGASAVQVGTAIFGDPAAPARVAEEISTALDERGTACVRDVVGVAHERNP